MVMQDIHFDKDVQVYRIFLFHLLFPSLFHHIAFGKIGLYFFWLMLLWHGIFSFPCSFDMVYFGLMLLWHGIFSFSPCSFEMVYFYIVQFSFLLRFLEERFIT